MTSFQDIYKTSYSHGLEKIYQLENIDIKSVKKLEPRKERSENYIFHNDSNLDELDLGEGFRLWIEPTVLNEPIQVLQLNKHSEKHLLERGVVTLKSLHQADLSQFVYGKGLGQGHIDEMVSKLNQYLNGKPLKRQNVIDFRSLILSLFKNIRGKEAFLILEPFNLHHWISLSPLDLVEIKKLTLSQKNEIKEVIKTKLSDEKYLFIKRFQEIENAFIKPWVNTRLGVASIEEISERLLRKSLDSSVASNALSFIYHYFPELSFSSLYYSSPQFEADYFIIEKETMSFFWKEETLHSFDFLFQKVAYTLCLDFRELTRDRFFRFLSLSKRFSINKKNNLLYISII